MPLEPGVRIRGVSAGLWHGLAVSEEGLIYLWGSRSKPASTLLSDQYARLVPTIVESLRGTRIRMVAAGAAHSVALSEDGVVFTWGDANATRNVDDENSYFDDRPDLSYCDAYAPGLGRRLEDGPDRMPQPVNGLAGVRIATMAAGVSYTLAVSEAGAVFSFGQGRKGRLGHGDELDVEQPKQIEALSGVCVLTVAAGGAHALALTRSGDVYSWGLGCDGQLGHGSPTTSTTTPAIIEALGDVRVDRIAPGEVHSCASSQAGGLYTWGSGFLGGELASGKLGHGTFDLEPVPKRIQALWGLSTLGLWAGSEHTFVLNNAGVLLGFGHCVAAGIPETELRDEFDVASDSECDEQEEDCSGTRSQMVPTNLGVRLRLP
jgi:alpha-tubulin suppressor-like RCC1 family protein